jgi:hypothetical protein
VSHNPITENLEGSFLSPIDAKFTYAGPNWTPTIDCPKRLPRSARHVATIEWAWSPAHSRQDRLHLSTNRSRTHWILWNGYLDDNEWPTRWRHSPYAFCNKEGLDAKTAALYLLVAGWRGELAAYGSPDEPFHYVTREGLLSAAELNLATEIFWRTESEAPGPAEIIRNIRENSARLARAIKENTKPKEDSTKLPTTDSYTSMDAEQLLRSLVSFRMPIEIDDEE